MKVLTLNARVWTRDLDKSSPYYWRTRMQAMNAMIEHIHPDVICLQEMSFPANLYIPREYRKCGLLSASHHIYCRRGMKVGRTGYRIHWNYAEIDGTTVICVHGTWKQKMEKICRRILHFKRGRRCVIAGDFNISLRKCWDYGFPFSARSMTYADEIETFRNFSRPDLSNGEIDHVFVANLCKASLLRSSVPDEVHMVQFVKDMVDNPNQQDGYIFNRWYADRCRNGMPIEWSDLL